MSAARIVTLLFITLLIGIVAIWGGLALWYQAPGGFRVPIIALWAAFSIACGVGLWFGWLAIGLLGFVAGFTGLLIWWNTLSPSNDRLWANDVAQMTVGKVDGNEVTLRNVRDFAWRTETDYTERWETRSYDLARLKSLDMIMSYWSSRAIAHTLMSFGFDDGTHVVFSVEIRREKTESFSEVGGFFKEFELSIIASDERDIVRLRTNVRREDTYLYRLRMSAPAMRSLFLAYVDEANTLAREPRFYHTITGNCTTLVYNMLKRIVGRLPISYRLLLSGYMPEYVYSVGGLDQRFPLEELRAVGYISDRGRKADQSAAFSAEIRQGIPSL
jgi:Domain of unknown function (DUF4105)